MPPVRLLSSLVVLTAVGGCASSQEQPLEPVATVPVNYDEAMLLRDWPTVEAKYLDGSVEAGPTYSPNRVGRNSLSPEPRPRQPLNLLSEPLTAATNFLLLPFRLVATPPWEDETYLVPAINPTYHAAPPADLATEIEPVKVVEVNEVVEVETPLRIVVEYNLPPKPTTGPATTRPATSRPATRPTR
jgi:hypothetical protein